MTYTPIESYNQNYDRAAFCFNGEHFQTFDQDFFLERHCFIKAKIWLPSPTSQQVYLSLMTSHRKKNWTENLGTTAFFYNGEKKIFPLFWSFFLIDFTRRAFFYHSFDCNFSQVLVENFLDVVRTCYITKKKHLGLYFHSHFDPDQKNKNCTLWQPFHEKIAKIVT